MGVVCCVIALCVATAQPAAAQDGSASSGVVARVHFADQADVNRLAGRLDVWSVDHRTHTLVAYLTLDEQRTLETAGYVVDVDVAQTAALAMSPIGAAGAAGAQTVPNYACYRTVEETYADLTTLAANFPALARWVDIGDTWQKTRNPSSSGYDIFALVLTNQAIRGPKPRFFLMAGIHAREMATAELATRFAERLVQQYGIDPDVTWLLDYTEIHIVAQANPDGRKQAEGSTSDQINFNPNSLWRKNVNNTDGCTATGRYGVDLNRNSSFKWGSCADGFCSSSYACDLIYRGSQAASEPETQVLEGYLRSIFPDQRGAQDGDAAPADATGLMVTLHSYSQLILFPWGWTAAPSPNDTTLRTLGRKFGFFTGYAVCQSGELGCIYQTDGTTDDFAYGELGIAAYTYEVGTAFFQSCATFEGPLLNNTLAALTYAAKAARRPYQAPAGPEVIMATVQPTQVLAGGAVTLTVTVDDTRFASNDPRFGQEPVQNVAGAAYTVDAPDWCPGVATVELQPVSQFDAPVAQAMAVIDTTGWLPGRHQVLVTGLDAANHWGVPTAAFVDVTDEEGLTPPVFFHDPACQGVMIYLPIVALQ